MMVSRTAGVINSHTAGAEEAVESKGTTLINCGDFYCKITNYIPMEWS